MTRDTIEQMRRSQDALIDELRAAGATVTNPKSFRCPFHDDGKASAGIYADDAGVFRFKCHGCGVSGDIFDIRARIQNRPLADVLRDAGNGNGDRPQDRPPAMPRDPKLTKPPPDKPKAAKAALGRIVEAYPYLDESGDLLYEVVRFDPKDFRQRRPDGKGGWTWNMNGVRRVLYRLPELLAADKGDWVFVVEGEKDADNLRALGLVATTNPGGAGRWDKLADDSALHGRRVAIIPDRDKADAKTGKVQGMEHAQDVARRLHGRSAMVKIVELPAEINGQKIKDVSDWLDAQDSILPEDLAAALIDMAEKAPAWTPPPAIEKVIGSEPIITCLADVIAVPVKWLWPSRIALGKLTLIVGDPGLGKSFITLYMAARITTGTTWPDCPGVGNTPGGVVLLSAEDDLADTIRPRLDAACANVRRVHAMTTVKLGTNPATGKPIFAPFNLTDHLPMLERTIGQVVDCRLVIIDPISAFLGKTDSHKNADVRGMLAPLSELAARYGVAVVAVNHLRKGEGPAMYRAMGSLAFIAAARAAYCVAKDKDDPSGQLRLFLPIKNNLGNDRDGLAYRLDNTASGNGQPVVSWESEPVPTSADDALKDDDGGRDSDHDDGGDTSEREEAKAWLSDILANGPRTAKEICAQAKEDRIAPRTLIRAKKDLKVKADKAKGVANGAWSWSMGEGCQQQRQGPGQENLGNVGNLGNLPEKPNENADSQSPKIEGCQECQGRAESQTALASATTPASAAPDPDKPGPVDQLNAEQRKRYLAFYYSRPASMSPDEKHDRAWKATLRDEK